MPFELSQQSWSDTEIIRLNNICHFVILSEELIKTRKISDFIGR